LPGFFSLGLVSAYLGLPGQRERDFSYGVSPPPLLYEMKDVLVHKSGHHSFHNVVLFMLRGKKASNLSGKSNFSFEYFVSFNISWHDMLVKQKKGTKMKILQVLDTMIVALLRPAQRSQDELEKRSISSIFFPIHLEIFELVSIAHCAQNLLLCESIV
jgi:hypothetical protein